ncbi:MAG: hypothetical protein LBV00_11110, partial [Propionibacteriaceae bacterium]|nr:hypothetical protein [Propionibacteriaceae bacterium]
MTPRQRHAGRPRTPHRYLFAALALIAGGVTGLGFPPFNLWWLLPVGLAAFVVLARLARPGVGALRGYLYGFGFNIVVIQWVYVALGLPVLLVFVAWLAVWQAAVGLVIAAARRTPAWGWCGVAAWMAAEWACARWPIGGFGWARLAFGAADSPLNGLFPFISATGVSAVIVVIGFLISWMVWPAVARFGVDATSDRSPDLADGRTGRDDDQSTSQAPKRDGVSGAPTPRARVGGGVARIRPGPVITLVTLVVGSLALGLVGRTYDPPSDGRDVTVAVVQGNVPGVGTTALGPRYTVENNHLAQTIMLAAKIRTGQVAQPDFVLWPENSTATDPFTDTTTAGIIKQALDLVGAPILAGSIIAGPGPQERQTVGLWWTTDGQVEAEYAKRNLVPFGEWIPARSLLMSTIPELKMVGAQSIPGTGP